MPVLDFKGKQFVYAHHLTVPFRQLVVDAGKSAPAKGAKPGLEDNLIIHGDNLHALKALLPKYAGRIKCIYIDPPYNTGTEGWCYNDKVNSPLMQEWLKKEANPVDKEDLERHDKWLAMMWPRLQLLRDLLADDGLMFISIDFNEHHRLKATLEETFGENNLISELIWKKKKGGGNDSKFVATEHEYVIICAKNKEYVEHLFASYTDDYLKRYDQEDEKGKYYWDTFLRKSGKQYYKIQCPDGTYLDKDEFGNPLSWLRSENRFKKDLEAGEVRITRIKDKWSVQFKQRLPKGKKPRSILDDVLLEDKGTTSSGNDEIFSIFGKFIFENPKPSSLISYLLSENKVKE